jgi:hypothetical protein
MKTRRPMKSDVKFLLSGLCMRDNHEGMPEIVDAFEKG